MKQRSHIVIKILIAVGALYLLLWGLTWSRGLSDARVFVRERIRADASSLQELDYDPGLGDGHGFRQPWLYFSGGFSPCPFLLRLDYSGHIGGRPLSRCDNQEWSFWFFGYLHGYYSSVTITKG